VVIAENFSRDGGGIANFSNSSPVLTNVIIAGNLAGNSGGGMRNENSSPVLTNVAITGNSAGMRGGGMYNLVGSPILTNVTIAGNSVLYSFSTFPDGGGGICNYASYSTPQIRNSIIWGNNASYGPGISGVYGSVDNSIVQGGWTGTGSNNSTVADGTGIFVNLQPATIDAPTTAGDYRLQAGSPAINAGSNTYYGAGQTPDLSGITTDLAGNPRKVDTIDIGAYEYKP
jgi:hypothetical protein